MNKKIIFSGGGTGGHIFPAINLMKHFFDKEYKVILVTDSRGNNFIKNYSEFKSYTLSAGTPTNKNLFKKFFSYFLIFYSIIRSIIILKNDLILITALVVIAWIDRKTLLIEGRLIALAMGLRLLWLSFFAPQEMLNSLTGLLIGAGILYFIGFLYETFRH